MTLPQEIQKIYQRWNENLLKEEDYNPLLATTLHRQLRLAQKQTGVQKTTCIKCCSFCLRPECYSLNIPCANRHVAGEVLLPLADFETKIQNWGKQYAFVLLTEFEPFAFYGRSDDNLRYKN